MKLLWITDPHLSFLPAAGASRTLGEYLCQEHSFDAVILSGDIAEAPSLRELLTDFAHGVARRPVYFVLGNHDYYRGSFHSVQSDLRRGFDENLVWLDEAAVTLLDADTALIGHQGWFDARIGDPEGSRVVMSDFELISELRELFINETNWTYGGRSPLLTELRKLGALAASTAKPRLLEALKARRTVIFVTHFPPFKNSCWHEGSISDNHWLPWFTCEAMGTMLNDVAREHPENRILTLCGHTHSPGTYDHAPNLRVLTGKSTYGAPSVSALLTTPIAGW